jgi:hypothetical protein
VSSATTLGEREIPAKEKGHREALRWAHELADEIVWAIEDCRDLSHHLHAAASATRDARDWIAIAPRPRGVSLG